MLKLFCEGFLFPRADCDDAWVKTRAREEEAFTERMNPMENNNNNSAGKMSEFDRCVVRIRIMLMEIFLPVSGVAAGREGGIDCCWLLY